MPWIRCLAFPSDARRQNLCRSLICALLLATSTAVAQSTSFERAVETGHSALQAYSEGAWSVAYERFAHADALAHSPVFVLYMARCKRNLGELLLARELLRAVIRERHFPDAPVPWHQAVASAHAELGTIQQAIPSIWIADAAALSAAVDGTAVLLSPGRREIELDPGTHVLEVRDRTGALRTSTIELAPGQRRVPMPLLRIEAPTRTESTVGREDRTATSPRGSTRPLRKSFGWAALGVGAAGLGLGIVTGLVAKAKRDDLDCTVCSRDKAGHYESASDWAAVSTVSFIFSGTALLSGTVLVFLPNAGATTTRAGAPWRGVF